MKKLTSAMALAIAFNALACSGAGGGGGAATAVKKNADAVKLEFFVMSQCPYGVQVVNAVKETVDKMGPDLDLSIDFIGTIGANGDLSSMHGPDEVTGDIAQLCIMKYAPANFMDILLCQNKAMKEVAKNWESCSNDAKAATDKIKACVTGTEGKQLATDSFNKAKAKGANGSPTIYLAGKPYNGRRGGMDFLRAVCGEHKGATKPAACAAIPEPVAVNVTVINDKNCAECDANRFVGMLNSRLAKPVIKTLDYNDAEGKALYEKIGGGNLPAILFDSSLDADKEAAQMFGRFLKPAGEFKTLDVGSSWNPVCATAEGCKLDACKNTIACRTETPNKLEVFVMSQCPFGVKALNAMEEVLKNFDNKITFQVNFIANGTAKDGFKALHGQPEVDENIRELCVIKNYEKNYKYMDYVLCRNKNIRDTNWESCAVNGIDAKKIKACFEGDEGKKLHEENIKIANGLGIGASPTWVANGKYKFSGVDPETIRKNLCQHNAGLKGCEKTLSGTAPGGAAPAGNCGAN